MTKLSTKQRLLNGEPFTFPNAYVGSTPEYFTIKKNDKGKPTHINSYILFKGWICNIESFGSKQIKCYTYLFNKRTNYKIKLSEISFK